MLVVEVLLSSHMRLFRPSTWCAKRGCGYQQAAVGAESSLLVVVSLWLSLYSAMWIMMSLMLMMMTTTEEEVLYGHVRQ